MVDLLGIGNIAGNLEAEANRNEKKVKLLERLADALESIAASLETVAERK
jgi:hypothetical protein